MSESKQRWVRGDDYYITWGRWNITTNKVMGVYQYMLFKDRKQYAGPYDSAEQCQELAAELEEVR